MTWTRVSWGGDIKFNTKDEKCAEVWLQWPLPLACSWLKPFRRPTTKGECESGMGGTVEGRGEHKLLKGHFQELSNLSCTYSWDQFQPRFPLCTPERIFGYFCNLFWAISHCLLDDVRTYLFLPKNSPSRPPNFRNNTNIIDLNMLETPNVWIHSQHGASGFFLFCFVFLQMSMQHPEKASGCAKRKTAELQCTFLYTNLLTHQYACAKCGISSKVPMGYFWSWRDSLILHPQ